MKMKNVLLIGIGGVYNYGCEAIVRGTIEILRNVDPAIKISYASYNYEDDVQNVFSWKFHSVFLSASS